MGIFAPALTIKAFTLNSPGIDEVAQRLGSLYSGVTIGKDPMFAWVQIINDVTILGEELRRNRFPEGAARAAKILFRLLEFLGYYLYIHQDSRQGDFADQFAADLRLRSYEHLFSNGPSEGPTRWILAKYPRACSKCGQTPCHCLLRPWIFEERRENSGPYVALKGDADAAREKLKKEKEATLLTLAEMLKMFEGIYKNSHYNQEPWKVGMHLTEELGEATIELSRLELAWRGSARFNIQGALNIIVEYTQAKIDKELERLVAARALEADISRRKEALETGLRDEKAAFAGGDAWPVFRGRVSEKFKEEVADVFSWLSAVLVKLDPKREVLEQQRSRFVRSKGTTECLKCPWCGSDACTDECLVTHSVSSEIIEKITKF